MKQRKSDKSNLEKARYLFLSIGFLFIAGITFAAFTYKTYDKNAYDFIIDIDEELADIPQIVQPPEMPEFTPPPPPPPKEPEIEIVENEVETPEEEFEDEEEEEMEINETEIEEEESDEALDDTPLMYSKDMPYYPECAGLKGRVRDKCTERLIHKKIKEAYVLPEIAREMGWEGTVYVRFVINKQGNVNKVEILKGVNDVLNKAAIEAVKKLPKASPGLRLDKPVSIIYTVPVKINFR